MPLSKLSPNELDRLEAEIAMTLADPSLPMDKRTELEQRLEVIRAKLGVEKPQ
jgi:hypothetical protein